MPSSAAATIPASSSMEPLFMDPRSYLYAAKSEGNLLPQFGSLLEKEITPQKNTVLHIAAKFGQTETVKEIHKHCPDLLRRQNSKGDTALHLAARNGFPDIVRFLIDQDNKQQHVIELRKGPQSITDHQEVAETDDEKAQLIIRMRNNKKDTALHEAVRNHFLFDGQKEEQYLEVVKLLTEGDLEFQCVANDAGETPLYIAAEEGLLDFVKQLLKDCSSSSHYRGPFGRTPLHAAAYGGRYVLVDEGTDSREIGCTDITTALLTKKADLIREVDEDGWSPLHFAAFCGSLDVVKLLLEKDKKVAYLPDKKGLSSIHIATQRGHSSVIRELILQCPDCHELVDDKGRNALHLMSMYTNSQSLHSEILSKDILIKSMVNEVDNNGDTPLHFAAMRNNYMIAAAILPLRIADNSAMNNCYFTPLDIILKNHEGAAPLHSLNIWEKIDAVRCRVRQVQHKKEIMGDIIRDKEISEGEIFVGDKEKSDQLKGIEKLDVNQRSNDSLMTIAGLIATVSFAAGLTMPGGFSSSSPNVGAAILAQN
ncbi:hypothetical protein NE237_013752 [Protea cynaroides]|uniref:PGG domain-containing protein n=1 Tax=Protea cynaroides TaxID=273540 RepID=A0A9Q0H0H9_9MAGN|nr:hypothetical protein NE237_013752 [Protea cynaroides]